MMMMMMMMMMTMLQVGSAQRLPAPAVQSDVWVLGVRASQAAHLPAAQAGAGQHQGGGAEPGAGGEQEAGGGQQEAAGEHGGAGDRAGGGPGHLLPGGHLARGPQPAAARERGPRAGVQPRAVHRPRHAAQHSQGRLRPRPRPRGPPPALPLHAALGPGAPDLRCGCGELTGAHGAALAARLGAVHALSVALPVRAAEEAVLRRGVRGPQLVLLPGDSLGILASSACGCSHGFCLLSVSSFSALFCFFWFIFRIQCTSCCV